MSEPEVSDLASCALLHDNALTEFILLQQGREEEDPNLGVHCEIGQINAEIIPFNKSINGYILYHHERADGLGPFGLTEGQYPLGAELIAAADMVDAEWNLERVSPEQLPVLLEKIKADIGSRFTERAGHALLNVLDKNLLDTLQNEKITETVNSAIPVWTMEMSDPSLVPIAKLISRIIDHKSVFTGIHTEQIANRIWLMSEYYGYDIAEKIQLYLAAALHDLGKLGTPSEVLEKQGKLDNEEFEIIKNHTVLTTSLLSAMEGLEKVKNWASNHHEKLDGTGYPKGKIASDLDFNSRLLACIDVYQAVSEKRPYHPARSHVETMPVLLEMAEKGKIDSAIVNDLDEVMAEWSGKEVKDPILAY